MPTIKRKTPKKAYRHNHIPHPEYQTKEWKDARALCLRLNPWCVMCGKKANSADHKVSPWGKDAPPYRSGAWWRLFLGQKNLQSMCMSPCHNRKSARDSNKRRKK